LMPEGNRLDVALGYLGPHITASTPGAPDAKSSADAFFMPAIGWAHKSGPFAYGIGVFAQGGMGTDYSADSFLAMGSGDKVRSELGVGRAIIPFTVDVNKNFTVGVTADFVWATLDLKMALPGTEFLAMAQGTSAFGSASGSLVNSLGGAVQAGQIGVPEWTRFDFSDNSDFTGAAKGTGFAGKIGGVYKVNDAVSFGATYHSKTELGDLEATGATLSMKASGPATGGQAIVVPITGKIQVKDFQWPQTIGVGVAYQATDKLMIAADYKWINWADVMKSFKLTFTADANQSGAAGPGGFNLGGQSVDATLFQNWKNQNVFEIGAGYKFTPEFTGRIGFNYANNPIPDQLMNPLFPAIEKSHVTLGAGYMITKASSVDASFAYAPEVKQTNGQQVTVAHSQTNAQVMYSFRF
ncbi:MAG TPA: outer membrane protein transport protein, partial [Nitrospirota bacterium]